MIERVFGSLIGHQLIANTPCPPFGPPGCMPDPNTLGQDDSGTIRVNVIVIRRGVLVDQPETRPMREVK